MRIAITGMAWPDVELERGVLGVTADEITRSAGESSAEIVAAAANAEVILTGPSPIFDADTIGQLSCRGIVRYGVGFENIDVDAARRASIEVAYVPDYGTDAVAFHTISLALAALRRIPLLDRLVKSGVWSNAAARPLHGPAALTVGIVGFGRIGRTVARQFEALGFGRIVACDAFVSVDEPGIESASLADVLLNADIVSLHAPGSQDGAPLVGPNEFATMKEGSIIVNTARGSLIDTDALILGLKAGRPGVAALDVFDPEPVDPSRFADVLDQVIMTPHVAWYSEESMLALRVKTAEEAKRILDGVAPLHPVPEDADA